MYSYSAFLAQPWEEERYAPDSELLTRWAGDGIELLSLFIGGGSTQTQVKMILKASPDLTAGFMAHRLKGRLQHALGNRRFRRDYHLQSLGQNDRNIVVNYIRQQVDRSDLIDPLYRKRMKALAFHQELSEPGRGKHRCIQDLILHVVLVTAERRRMFSPEARKVAGVLQQVAEEEGMELFDLAMMPDHAHLMLRPAREQAPAAALACIREQSAGKLMFRYFWQQGGYSGTVGPRTCASAMEALRRTGAWMAEESGMPEFASLDHLYNLSA